MRLASSKRTEFRVGIINTALEAGVLISPRGALAVAEFFRGYSTDKVSTWNLSWSAREQLDASVDKLTFEVLRKSIRSRGCSDLRDSLDQFYTELENVLQSSISLSQIPQERQLQEVIVDGTSYVIQIWTGERVLVIYPDRDIDKELDRVSAELMRVVGRCSNNQPGTIESHYVD